MEMALKQVKTILNQLDAMHCTHIDDFDRHLLPDIEQQMAEREKNFVVLKKTMDRLLPALQTMEDVDDIPEIDDIISQVKVLINQNQTLVSRVQHHKDGLETSMKRNTRGRQAIHAYGSPSSQRNQPKVLNFRK